MQTNITVVTCNRLSLTKKCLTSLLENTQGQYRLTIVDNCSTDGTKDFLHQLARQYSCVHVICLSANMGVAVAANLGWHSFQAEYYLKLDNDIEIYDPLWLEQLLKFAKNNKNLGMIGYQLEEWASQTELGTLPGGETFISSDLCNGGCVLIPQKVHAELGFWIEDHGRYGYEDKNYSDRALLAGYMIGYHPDKKAVRHMGYDDATLDQQLEIYKKQNIASKKKGEQLYVFNKFLFDKGIRKLYVDRKYLPESIGGQIRFSINPAYKPILKIQQEYLHKIAYQGHHDSISLDLSKIL